MWGYAIGVAASCLLIVRGLFKQIDWLVPGHDAVLRRGVDRMFDEIYVSSAAAWIGERADDLGRRALTLSRPDGPAWRALTVWTLAATSSALAALIAILWSELSPTDPIEFTHDVAGAVADEWRMALMLAATITVALFVAGWVSAVVTGLVLVAAARTRRFGAVVVLVLAVGHAALALWGGYVLVALGNDLFEAPIRAAVPFDEAYVGATLEETLDKTGSAWTLVAVLAVAMASWALSGAGLVAALLAARLFPRCSTEGLLRFLIAIAGSRGPVVLSAGKWLAWVGGLLAGLSSLLVSRTGS